MSVSVQQVSHQQDSSSDVLTTQSEEVEQEVNVVENENETVVEDTPESEIPFDFENQVMENQEEESTNESTELESPQEDMPTNESQSGPITEEGPPTPDIQEVEETPEALPVPEPPINTENSSALINSVGGLPATSFVMGMRQVGQLSSSVQEAEQQTMMSNLPEIEQPTGLPVLGSSEIPEYTPVSGDIPELEARTGGPENEVSIEHESDLAPIPQQTAPNIEEPQDSEEEESSWWDSMTNFLSRQFNSIRTTDPGVNTSAGERPNVDTSGEADPIQNNENQASSNESVLLEQRRADLNSTEYRGEQEIYPDMEREMLSPDITPTALQEREPRDINELTLTAEVQDAINAEAQSQMDAEVNAEVERNNAEYERYQEESVAEQESANEHIALETENTRAEQETAQNEAQDEVTSQRANWEEENEQVRTEYSSSSEEERQNVDGQIETEIQTTDEQVETQYAEAETEAQRQRTEAEAEAEAERAEAERERENQSRWERLKGAVADFFDALRSAINFIFDQLREAVRFVIEQAKRAVNALIDLARDAIIGLIQAFGEILKGLVSIALAAFPEIRDRVLGLIDAAVNLAVEVVNQLAQALKEIANAILDALGSVLDFILSAYQAIYNAIIDVLEFITVGLMQIIEFLGNLVVGAWHAPGEFFGALATEAIGGNPADPLPNFEVPNGQERQWAEAMGISEAVSNESDVETNEMEIPAEPVSENIMNLLRQPELSNDSVEVEPDPAVELDEALLSQLSDLDEGDTFEIGGAGENAITTEDFQTSIAEEMGISLDDFSEGLGTEEESVLPADNSESEVELSEGAGEVPDPDWRNMDNEEKLDHYLGQMLQETNEAAQQEPAPSQEQLEVNTELSEEALVTKTGRLDVGDRLAFMGQQMLNGIQLLWNNYKAWIIGGLVAALLAAGIIAFFTGGAGLVAVVQVIGQALILIFGAYAVGRAMGSVWDYINSAWDGDSQKAGRNLATAFAIIIVEFFLDKILLGMGKVFKRILTASRNAIRSTRIGRRALVGVAQTRRVINRGVRAVRRTVRRGVARVRNNKFVVSLGNRIGGGVRRFSRLRDDILNRFRFKRIWVEKHGRYVEIWGRFNPDFLLGRDEVVHADNRFSPSNRAQWRRNDVTGDYEVLRPGTGTGRQRWEPARLMQGDEAIDLPSRLVRDADGNVVRTVHSRADDAADITSRLRTETRGRSRARREARTTAQRPDVQDALSTPRSQRTASQQQLLDDYHVGRNRVSVHSENIGEIGAQSAMRNRFPDHELRFGEVGGPGTFDQVYVKPGPPREYVLVEAKGGSADLGSARVDTPAGPQRAQQGSREYRDHIIRRMTRSSDPEIARMGRELSQAQRRRLNIQYYRAQTPIDNNGNVLDTIITQFES